MIMFSLSKSIQYSNAFFKVLFVVNLIGTLVFLFIDPLNKLSLFYLLSTQVVVLLLQCLHSGLLGFTKGSAWHRRHCSRVLLCVSSLGLATFWAFYTEINLLLIPILLVLDLILVPHILTIYYAMVQASKIQSPPYQPTADLLDDSFHY